MFCGVHFMAESADVLVAPHQQVILPDLAAGCSMADMAAIDQLEMCWDELAHDRASSTRRVVPGHLHQLGGRHQSLRRRARRHRLHVVERGGDAASGRGSAASGSCSCPISISAATPRTRWACRSTRWWCGIRTRSSAASTPEQVQRREDDSVEGALLGPRRASPCAQIEQHPRAASRRPRHRASRSAVGRRAGRRRQRLDRIHHPARSQTSPAGSVWAVGTEIHLVNRLAQRGRAGADRAVARSVRLPVLDDVPRVAEPPALDSRRAASRARSTTASSSPTSRSTGRRSRSIGCCRFTY